jgi:hypothetical protein
LQKLQFTASNNKKSLLLFIHHTNSIRQWAYDGNSRISALNKGLEEAIAKGWTIVNMKNDWIKIY